MDVNSYMLAADVLMYMLHVRFRMPLYDMQHFSACK